jgi:hypothetical protein
MEVRDTDGTLYPACAVVSGESVDWPQPIAGFSGWSFEPAPSAAENGSEETADGPATGSEPAPAAKPRSKAPSKATDTTTEATA